jgi:hypothetical protein
METKMNIALKIAGGSLALILMTSAAALAQDGQPATHGGPIVSDDTPSTPPSTHGGGPIVGGDRPLHQPPGPPHSEGDEDDGHGNGGNGGGPTQTPVEPNPEIGSVDATPQMSCAAIGWEGGGPMDGVLRNLQLTNTGAGPIYINTTYVVTTSTGETFDFVIEITLQPGQSDTWSNVFPNGVPDDFSCDVFFA